tara:strand:- start:429 stop:587 length:159 start_codon:yes stop_codon:yes gene_type:complete
VEVAVATGLCLLAYVEWLLIFGELVVMDQVLAHVTDVITLKQQWAVAIIQKQ